MDGAQGSHLYSAVGASEKPRRVGGRGGRDAAFGASLGETASGADLLILRCRLFLSLRTRIRQVMDCSPTNRERELGLDRRETG